MFRLGIEMISGKRGSQTVVFAMENVDRGWESGRRRAECGWSRVVVCFVVSPIFCSLRLHTLNLEEGLNWNSKARSRME